MASLYDSYVTTATQDLILPTIYDSVLWSNVLCARLLSKPKLWRWEQMKVNFRVWASNASAAKGWGFRGTDTFDTSRQDETVQWAANPKFIYEPFNIVYTDLATNAWPEQVIDIVKRDSEYALSNLMDNVWTMIYSTNSESSKWFTGLRNIIAATWSYIWLDRSTYTVLKPWGTSVAWIDSSTTTLTLASMRSVSNAVTSWWIKPTIIVTTKSIFWFYEKLLTPMQQMNIWWYAQVTKDWLAQSKMWLWWAAWFDALMWDWIPVVRDEKCTANYMYFLNENYLDFYELSWFGAQWNYKTISLKPDIVQGQYDQNAMPWHKIWLTWTWFKEPTNQAAASSQIFLSWELVCTQPKYQWVMSAITA